MVVLIIFVFPCDEARVHCPNLKLGLSCSLIPIPFRPFLVLRKWPRLLEEFSDSRRSCFDYLAALDVLILEKIFNVLVPCDLEIPPVLPAHQRSRHIRSEENT